jgi:murein DD-endopeptidase MepM/ murein hydrolase activator NlpD
VFRLRLRGCSSGAARLIMLLIMMVGSPMAASAAPEPVLGTYLWWTAQADALASRVRQGRAALAFAAGRHLAAQARQVKAHEHARWAKARHDAAARSLLHLDERRRALDAACAAEPWRLNAGLAMLGRRVLQEGRAGPAVARARLVASGLVEQASRQRHRCRELARDRGSRALELRALAAEARFRLADAAVADAVATSALASRRMATTEVVALDGRRAAVARQAGRLTRLLAGLSPLTLAPSGGPRVSPPGAPDPGHRRPIDLDRRLDHRLLLLAGTAVRPPPIERRRRLASVAVAAAPILLNDGDRRWPRAFTPAVPMLRPISGELVGPARAGAAIPEPGITLQSRVSQTVSAPSGGRVVFAGPFPGSGSLLIIDRGGGYHVLMTGLARLDVREGASVVAGQAVGEIVAQGDEPARLYLELRYRGVPLDPAPRLAAREDKVRS